ncbi:MAG: hypothetical protein J3K34DRAFT_217214 [Monoraphidium minutum]|nr:MAG: hypothetical protein J3K34DRAFT_217214 [Monoraphidium minutum]
MVIIQQWQWEKQQQSATTTPQVRAGPRQSGAFGGAGVAHKGDRCTRTLRRAMHAAQPMPSAAVSCNCATARGEGGRVNSTWWCERVNVREDQAVRARAVCTGVARTLPHADEAGRPRAPGPPVGVGGQPICVHTQDGQAKPAAASQPGEAASQSACGAKLHRVATRPAGAPRARRLCAGMCRFHVSREPCKKDKEFGADRSANVGGRQWGGNAALGTAGANGHPGPARRAGTPATGRRPAACKTVRGCSRGLLAQIKMVKA